MFRGVVYRLIEYLASMGHSSIWKLIFVISVSNILTVGVHLSSTPSISGPGSATAEGGTGGPDPPGKSQVIWVSIGNKQLDPPPPPGKSWTPPPPLENAGPPSGTLQNDRCL